MTAKQKSPFALPPIVLKRQLRDLVERALHEDIGRGDLTVQALELGRQRSRAHIVAKSKGILSGSDAVTATFRALDSKAKLTWRVTDGKVVRKGMIVAEIYATPSALLSGERTALNFLSRLSGVATTTRDLVDKLKGTHTRLLDTRKTTPGWRYLEKQAALTGGAVSHRMGLHDALMIKSNHVVAVGNFEETVRRAVRNSGRRTLICEVRSIREIRAALDHGVPWLLLDHFRGQRLRHAISVIREHDTSQRKTGAQRTIIEVSGNVDKRSIRSIARYGPDFVSSGGITHSAQAIDFSLRWVEGR
ncbi:MAG: carboxylating nicotinate-nucleotide diphosphorylase [candidate division Zixibacteria bacterium]|nr:carboxylating nicotinate-nucleotide diphosphorylase [candidate division Zixibacteria bacterium]